MNLEEYLRLASKGAPIIIVGLASGGPIVAHTWAVACNGLGGWEYVVADYHGKILGQAWVAGTSVIERDQEIAATITQLAKRLATSKAVA